MDLEDPVTSFFHITLFEDLVRNLLVLFLPQDPQGSLLPVAIFHPDHPAFHVDSGAWYDLCGSLCSWLWFLALSFLAGLQLHWQNFDCQCHMRLWTQPLCMVFPSEKGFPAHCLSELFDLTCCDPAKISLDKTCEAHDDRKGYLLDLLYIYIYIYILYVYIISCCIILVRYYLVTRLALHICQVTSASFHTRYPWVKNREEHCLAHSKIIDTCIDKDTAILSYIIHISYCLFMALSQCKQ